MMVTLSAKQVKLIEDTWDYLLLNSVDVGVLFYKKLFEIDPDVQKLFKIDIDSQVNKLISTVTYIVHRLHNLDVVTQEVEQLGRRHVSYQVELRHYDFAAVAFLHSLKQSMGNKWCDEIEQAWANAYWILSKIMIEQARAMKTG